MMTTRHCKSPGFTLIESAIAILILGLMIGAMATLFTQSQKQQKETETRQKMQKIVRALSTYVETSSRLPCPADPALDDQMFGWEWNVDAADTTVTAGAAPSGWCDPDPAVPGGNSVAGVVPFQTLNLLPSDIIDGWGRYFTYAVSPEFTLDNDASVPDFKDGPAPSWIPNDTNDHVHARCRDGAWLGQNDNINAPKARFCCAAQLMPAVQFYPPATDIEIRLATGGNPVISPARPGYGGDYNTLNTLYATLDKPVIEDLTSVVRATESTANITAPAFVLISHGENGRGAFLANNTNAQFSVDNTFVLERENWNGNVAANRVFYTGQRSLSNVAANYFDDIVLWMTQDGIMAANGTSSCQYP